MSYVISHSPGSSKEVRGSTLSDQYLERGVSKKGGPRNNEGFTELTVL